MTIRSQSTAPLALFLALAFGCAATATAGGATCSKKAEDKKASSEAVYAVDGEVQKPKRTGGPVPSYPESAKEERIEGTVVTRIIIEKDGSVSDAEVVQSLGEDFDRLAVDAVRLWTFEPASLDGEPIRVHYNITINYRLDGDATDS